MNINNTSLDGYVKGTHVSPSHPESYLPGEPLYVVDNEFTGRDNNRQNLFDYG